MNKPTHIVIVFQTFHLNPQIHFASDEFTAHRIKRDFERKGAQACIEPYSNYTPVTVHESTDGVGYYMMW